MSFSWTFWTLFFYFLQFSNNNELLDNWLTWIWMFYTVSFSLNIHHSWRFLWILFVKLSRSCFHLFKNWLNRCRTNWFFSCWRLYWFWNFLLNSNPLNICWLNIRSFDISILPFVKLLMFSFLHLCVASFYTCWVCALF